MSSDDKPQQTTPLISDRRAWTCPDAPPPAGSYNQAVSVGGMLYISGQTARLPDGTRISDSPFEEQARAVLTNVEAIANTASTSIANAAMVTVYLTEPQKQAATFDRIYREFLTRSAPHPARAIVESKLPHGQIEITAIIPL